MKRLEGFGHDRPGDNFFRVFTDSLQPIDPPTTVDTGLTPAR